MAGGYQQRTFEDRFGVHVLKAIKGAKKKDGSKTEFRCSGLGVAYVEIKGDLYKMTITAANKDGIDGWIKITKKPKQQRSSGGF